MIQEKDAAGWTMPMYTAALEDTDMVSQHLDEKDQRDKQGQTALIIAAQNGRGETVKLLMKHENGVPGLISLICSACLGDVYAVKSSIHEKGHADIIGMTAFMWAAYQGHQGAVEILLEHKKGMEDKDGNTASAYTLMNKHTSIAIFLREHEAPCGPLSCVHPSLKKLAW
ncbi:Ankyrin repeat protein 1 [Giardia duodenalis]|uniref:Ankyrin repeat protein 1 n=1 Tax=Giardia intestinalis (strain ATCC 50803 / WB clone C6) TaxID=184922 RepID=A8B2D3_GIAIC|nr:Ankyrin repeat protein 1 [Giardia intestinalis]XP_001709951.1 Ankyrin repeat protein 1 [Giardia intestinalis]KAE8302958.1 Ankyrin repeat protein 1 [Giardia intestinalis]KAE8302960.1 Ankyrin repeat protein 1 [Giardia intestinalis]|eukprot:XP_001709946.1 Hypothetical protein GL50803_115444 [Giardia lamblia ATCC 50803]